MADSFIRIRNPHGRRWMMFVDGENFTLRGQAVAAERGIQLREGEHCRRDTFLWMPGVRGIDALQQLEEPVPIQERPVRSFYFASVKGDDALLDSVRDALGALAFLPRVHKRAKTEVKAKGVDIQLCTDMLSNAFMDNYDIAFLVTGDGDFLPLVQEVQRLGKRVHLIAFRKGLSDELRRGCDLYLNCEDTFAKQWG